MEHRKCPECWLPFSSSDILCHLKTVHSASSPPPLKMIVCNDCNLSVSEDHIQILALHSVQLGHRGARVEWKVAEWRKREEANTLRLLNQLKQVEAEAGSGAPAVHIPDLTGQRETGEGPAAPQESVPFKEELAGPAFYESQVQRRPNPTKRCPSLERMIGVVKEGGKRQRPEDPNSLPLFSSSDSDLPGFFEDSSSFASPDSNLEKGREQMSTPSQLSVEFCPAGKRSKYSRHSVKRSTCQLCLREINSEGRAHMFNHVLTHDKAIRLFKCPYCHHTNQRYENCKDHMLRWCKLKDIAKDYLPAFQSEQGLGDKITDLMGRCFPGEQWADFVAVTLRNFATGNLKAPEPWREEMNMFSEYCKKIRAGSPPDEGGQSPANVVGSSSSVERTANSDICCKECDRVFTTTNRTELFRHCLTHDKTLTLFKCPYCEQQFQIVARAKQHVQFKCLARGQGDPNAGPVFLKREGLEDSLLQALKSCFPDMRWEVFAQKFVKKSEATHPTFVADPGQSVDISNGLIDVFSEEAAQDH